MTRILSLLDSRGLLPKGKPRELSITAGELETLVKAKVYANSVAASEGVIYSLARDRSKKFLCLLTGALSHERTADFTGRERIITLDSVPGRKRTSRRELLLKSCDLTVENGVALRKHLEFTAPRVIGVRKAIGMGDRLGLAAPGHVRAVQRTGLAPFFAQQSVREISRLGRTAEEVLACATWGVFEEGFRESHGADADHLKTVDDAIRSARAGFTMFTVDPGDHVDNACGSYDAETLKAKFEALPLADLETTFGELPRRYSGKTVKFGKSREEKFEERAVVCAAVKYGRAVAHATKIFRALAQEMGKRPFELEMSVDETLTPTTPLEHFFVASELKRLGVRLVSLAPRFVGDFEKGVDYKGSVGKFERSFAEHVAVAGLLGPYKMSIHSGSDKFIIFPIASRLAGELVHLKTSGTSYLEALRVIAGVEPELFRDIVAFALERYSSDRATYHVSAEASNVPAPRGLKDKDLPPVLDLFDARQVLHVTFGSVLTSRGNDGNYRFRDRILKALFDNEGAHYEAVAAHLKEHIAPFESVSVRRKEKRT